MHVHAWTHPLFPFLWRNDEVSDMRHARGELTNMEYIFKRGERTFFLLMRYIQVPFVLACLDGLLGSPVPMVLLARTRNSYSTQGLRSITVAVSWWPPTTSGTGIKHTVPPSVSRNFMYVCVCVCAFFSMCVCQLNISSMMSSRLTGLAGLHHRVTGQV